MIRSLKELSTIYYGKSPNSIRVEDSQFPIYGTGGQVGCASVPLFNGPLVVVARKGTLSKPIFSESACWVIDTAYALITKPDVDAKWLYYNLDNYNLESLNEATGVPSISRDYLYRVEVEFVSKPEQCQIQKILSTIDNLIKQTHSLIAKYNAIKQGMMQDLFTRGVDSCGKLRPTYVEAPNLYKESELGKVPKDWRISNVGGFLQRIEQGWSPDCSNDRAENNQWGVLKTTAVVWDGYNYLENKVLPNQLHPRPEYEVKVGDILMTRGGPNSRVGVVAYVYNTQQKLMLSDKIYRLVPKSSINPEFLYLALASSHTQMHLSTMKTGLAESQTNISQKIVGRLLIPIPIPVEQQTVVSYSYRLNQVLLQEMQYLEKLKIIKSGLMQDLLTGKVRVKVDESTGIKQDVGVLQS